MDANRSLETTTTSSASKSCARDSARVKGKYLTPREPRAEGD